MLAKVRNSKDTIRGYFSGYDLDTVAQVDNDRMFVLIGQKKGYNSEQ